MNILLMFYKRATEFGFKSLRYMFNQIKCNPDLYLLILIVKVSS